MLLLHFFLKPAHQFVSYLRFCKNDYMTYQVTY